MYRIQEGVIVLFIDAIGQVLGFFCFQRCYMSVVKAWNPFEKTPLFTCALRDFVSDEFSNTNMHRNICDWRWKWWEYCAAKACSMVACWNSGLLETVLRFRSPSNARKLTDRLSEQMLFFFWGNGPMLWLIRRSAASLEWRTAWNIQTADTAFFFSTAIWMRSCPSQTNTAQTHWQLISRATVDGDVINENEI